MSSPAEEPKKKTRRRLRVSCVECTRRRQKCDRQQPCGLCTSRGVVHLCRWELEPFARPSPVRPPNGILSRKADAHDESSNDSSPPILEQSAVGAVDQEVKEAAIALAQLSVARQGEYLGIGSVVCSLHRLDDAEHILLDFDKSTLPYSADDEYSSAVTESFDRSIEGLLSSLPSKDQCDNLITSFFEHENWRHTLPPKQIFSTYSRMWEALQDNGAQCVCRIRAHWLTLLFAIFALSPYCASEDESRKYFLQSLTARRLAEDLFFASFSSPRTPLSVSEGNTQGCLAVALLAHYLCDRGQVTEAWKIVGTAVRNAQNAGMHRNPHWSKWKNMSEDEQLFRRTAWILLSNTDKFLSSILGRPSMIRSQNTDVPTPPIPKGPLSIDGASDTNLMFQACLSMLIDIVGELRDKYLALDIDVDQFMKDANPEDAFEDWRKNLPDCFALRNPDTTRDHIYPDVPIQRCMLSIYYLSSAVLFRRTLLSTRPSLACRHKPSDDEDGTSLVLKQMSTPRVATSLLVNLRELRALLLMKPRRQTCFVSTFFIFEAAVTLVIAERRDEQNPQAIEWRNRVQDSVNMLEELRAEDNGDIVIQSLQALRALQKAMSSTPNIPAVALFSPRQIESAVKQDEYHDAQRYAQYPTEDMNNLSGLSNNFLQWIQAPLAGWNADGSNMTGDVSGFDLLHFLQ